VAERSGGHFEAARRRVGGHPEAGRRRGAGQENASGVAVGRAAVRSAKAGKTGVRGSWRPLGGLPSAQVDYIKRVHITRTARFRAVNSLQHGHVRSEMSV
jgi:hypothetical protein